MEGILAASAEGQGSEGKGEKRGGLHWFTPFTLIQGGQVMPSRALAPDDYRLTALNFSLEL
jgi:hypothetical protein